MNIVDLSDLPEAVPIVSKWLFDEWGYRKVGNTVEKVRGRLELTLNKEILPIILIALDDKTPIGTASLRQSDGIITKPKLSPWLASVYITPEYRGKGVATKLIEKITSTAKQQNKKKLYLRTETQESLYHHLGWTTLETLETEKESTTIMYLEL